MPSLVALAGPAVLAAACVTAVSLSSPGTASVSASRTPAADQVDAQRTPPPAGNLSVSVPRTAVVLIVGHRMKAAWTNSGRPPSSIDDVHVLTHGVQRPATPEERDRLVRCAARATTVSWLPGVYVKLSGPACAQ